MTDHLVLECLDQGKGDGSSEMLREVRGGPMAVLKSHTYHDTNQEAA